MDLISGLGVAIQFFKNGFAYVLKKCGLKIVPKDDYKEEVIEVDFEFPNTSPECIEESKKGATFVWSAKLPLGSKKYFQIEDDTKRFFKMRNQYLWIKR
jgi:hypothetical protein